MTTTCFVFALARSMKQALLYQPQGKRTEEDNSRKYNQIERLDENMSNKNQAGVDLSGHTHWTQAVVFLIQQSVGSSLGRDTCVLKIKALLPNPILCVMNVFSNYKFKMQFGRWTANF